MSCFNGRKPLVSSDLFIELEKTYLDNITEDGVPLLSKKLETKEPELCKELTTLVNGSIKTLTSRFEHCNINLTDELITSIRNDYYYIFLMGYLLHSRASDINWETEFKL